ncbi:tubulin binding cofactor A [Cryphonectria parasitica EP155]|uniref:Tubulin-specific chaperone A n=1 Tax=Cryphonectria parasitica (strain ATCC 38755 / EP155) TaxID=660469 RepID=A0A9P4XX48_CRYP1|nr:tubulin binding cofactor A [Cryphonectria parasitica EP155]KAF3762370.1 tubulin binding cofactor A [Cryphonectria parasitica EP155]
MPAPSPLSIATSSVQRLVKEETYYHKDLASQQARVEKLEKDAQEPGAAQQQDENAGYMLNQEKKALEETKAVFGPLRGRIADAVSKLEEQIAIGESENSSAEELARAREALKQGEDSLKKSES